MGDPRKSKRLYSKPKKMWDKNRLEAEKPITSEFGLKNKKELWKVSSLLRKYTHHAKRIIASRSQQSEVEKKQIIERLVSLGIIPSGSSIDEVLGLTINDFFGRRLETLVFKKNFAHTVKQARQFIVHRHIKVGDKVITSPSFLVPKTDEASISFVEGSAFVNVDHPERAVKKVVMKEAVVKEAPAENAKGSN